jgi:nucleoid-associated protein YgaU
MPNDAKFGLVVGVGLVIAVAVVFFRKDLPGPKTATQDVKPAAVAAHPPDQRPALSSSQSRAPDAQPTSQRNQTHVIAEGETLFSIAEKHYGDGSRFIDIYQANRDVLKNPDKLPVGATLRLP